jgi:hypothetical protein
VRIVEYRPEHFELVRSAAERMGVEALSHRPFVDHYYTAGQWCRLYLAMVDEATLGATIGFELMPFEYQGRPLTLGLGTNFHSLEPGSGGHLFMQWIKRCEVGFVFGGTADTHRILGHQKWTYFQGVRTYYLNPTYRREENDTALRVLAKWTARRLTPRVDLRRRVRQIGEDGGAGIAVREEREYDASLLPDRSPFTLRFAPSVEYLRWRYDTRLSFVRYRPFRILASGSTAGYVILNDAPDRLIVAQCDARDPAILARGVLLALAEAAREDRRPREMMLTCSHAGMQRLFEQFGLVTNRRWDRSFVLGLNRTKIQISPDTSGWLVNFDWGDNGLRAPFLDQRPAASRPV